MLDHGNSCSKLLTLTHPYARRRLQNPEEAVNMGNTKAIVTKATKDQEFRQRLLQDPKATIAKELGVDFPEGVTVHVHENSPGAIHLVLPAMERTLSEQELSQVAGGIITGTLTRSPTLSPRLGPTLGAPLQPLPGPLSPMDKTTFEEYTGCCS
jgi:hypothetical protein